MSSRTAAAVTDAMGAPGLLSGGSSDRSSSHGLVSLRSISSCAAHCAVGSVAGAADAVPGGLRRPVVEAVVASLAAWPVRR